MINIENLEVQFDVAGENDEQVFAQYFSQYIQEWYRNNELDRQMEERLRQDQRLGD